MYTALSNIIDKSKNIISDVELMRRFSYIEIKSTTLLWHYAGASLVEMDD